MAHEDNIRAIREMTKHVRKAIANAKEAETVQDRSKTRVDRHQKGAKVQQRVVEDRD